MNKRFSTVKNEDFKHSGSYSVEGDEPNCIKIRSDVKHHKLCMYKNEHDISYFEISIVSRKGVCRVGYATEKAEMLGPLGYDAESFGYQMKNGYFITKSKRRVIGERITPGNILSCFLNESEDGLCVYFYQNGIQIHDGIKVDKKPGQLRPALSLYGGAEAELNFGPLFSYEDKIRSTELVQYEQLNG